MLKQIRTEIQKFARPDKAAFVARFFKTGVGEYGEGDVFLGLTVPQSRKIATFYKDLPLADIEKLLASKIHEERLIALLLLVQRFQKGDGLTKKEVYAFYLAHTQYINNWDLVDLSADKIVGEYLFFQSVIASKDDALVKLASSQNIWKRRISIISTYAFIKHGNSAQTLQIAAILVHDTHDLIQKAVGWMLREVGKRVSQEDEEQFLQKHYHTMPRTMLRYAIERFSEEKRQGYLRR